MKILFIAPLPPPVSGNSLAAKVLLDDLVSHYDVEVINLNKQIQNDGYLTLGRTFEIFNILKRVWFQKKSADTIYLTVSQTVLGNIRDVFIYLLCFRQNQKMVIHLHGGYMKTALFDKYKLLNTINKFFIRRLKHVVVLGESHVHIFQNFVPHQKIRIVPNFAEDYLFRSIPEIKQKYNKLVPLRILYLSNMLLEKGYNELIDAYLSLDEDLQKKIIIDFAGDFEYCAQKLEFLKKIHNLSNINYHGLVFGETKKGLLQHAHVLCLPTYYRNEGQPISILEAYASGCVVITTNHSGIKDVFSDGVNGYYVEKRSTKSLRSVIERTIENKECLFEIGIHNRNMAHEKYRTTIYNNSLRKLISEKTN